MERQAGMTTIRTAVAGDFESVQMGGDAPDARLRRKIDAQEVIVAEAEGAVVGFLYLEYLWSHIPFIANIRVQPARQRQGVGRALLAHVEKEMRRQGCPFLYS